MAMALQTTNLDYYDKMQELEERLKRSEEERMLLQRQFDLLVQANHEKERARVSAVEARYKRFLDEDRRRRDRNSSLLQALDRIDSHTASLAAKTERMRALRKHYEAFIAHSYPGWQMEMERSYCPLAAIAPASASNVMARVSDITGYDTENQRCLPDPNDYSETQYHALPSVTHKSLCPISSPLCRSELSIASREDYPTVGRSPYRSGSAIRSASLSPSRVRDLSSQYDSDQRPSSSLRNFDLYPSSKSLDRGLSVKNESQISKRSDINQSPRPTRYHSDFSGVKQTPYRAFTSISHNFPDYEHVNSDIEADQNTSGDLLNLSNLSLSDDGVLNESEIPDSPSSYTMASLHQSYTSPRDSYLAKKSLSTSLPMTYSSLRNVSPREAFIPKRSTGIPPSIFLDSTPKSILSPRSRKIDLPSSVSVSDSIHRILLPSEDLNVRRSDASLSPRRQTSSWQTLRPNYIQSPRSSVRRSVTFTEPEFESPYVFRDEDVGLYGGSHGSLRRHSPSAPSSSWEPSDHERYLREKQGREKDAFREKIERLKELIQENKDQDIGLTTYVMDGLGKASYPRSKSKEYLIEKENEFKDKAFPRESSDTKDWKASQSRRSSVVRELSSESPEQLSEGGDLSLEIDKQEKQKTISLREDDDLLSDTISDKEQWSGQFNEKDEDMQEKEKENKQKLEEELNKGKYSAIVQESKGINKNLKYDEDFGRQTDKVTSETDQQIQSSEENQQPNQMEVFASDTGSAQQEPPAGGEGSADFIYAERHQPLQGQREDYTYEEETPTNQTTDFDSKPNDLPPAEQDGSQFQEKHQIQAEHFSDYANDFGYEGDQQQQQQWATGDGNQDDQEVNNRYNYVQDQQSSVDYNGQNQKSSVPSREAVSEQYNTDEQKQQSYENYEPTTEQTQQEMQENYEERTAYDSYQEPQSNSGNNYQDYPQDQSQYQQNYQGYAENQDYGTQEQNNYQYPDDPNKTQYEYEGQDYNYQQDQDNYNYSQDPNYQPDASYQEEQAYQTDESYQQDQAYQQQYQDPAPAYQEPQEGQYGGYQPEDTAGSTYQGTYQEGESSDPQQTLQQYRALLGADPNSEPVYSDSSEIENQMAAVVGQGGNVAASITEPIQPASVSPPSSSSAASPATAKGKAGAKKRQLTRKQSSITADNVDGKQQTPNLPKTPEPAASQLQSDSDFDFSSSH